MAEIVTAGVGFVSGWLLALFGETFRLWLVGPRLTVDFKDAGHYVTDTPEEFRDSSGKVFSTHSALTCLTSSDQSLLETDAQ